MSVITSKGFPTLIRAIRTVDGTLDWIKDQKHSDIVPEHEETMKNWLRIRSTLPCGQEVCRPLRVLYTPRDPCLPSGRVEIRVQGILENGNIHPSGQWIKHSDNTVIEKIQWLRLGCNDPKYRERFNHQILILKRLINVCREKLGYKRLSSKLPSCILCRRWLSYRNRPLEIQMISEEGILIPCSYSDVSVEDILDVRVFIDIAFFKGPDSVPRPVINLSFDHVILTSKEKSGLQRCHSMMDLLKKDFERNYRMVDGIAYERFCDVTRSMWRE